MFKHKTFRVGLPTAAATPIYSYITKRLKYLLFDSLLANQAMNKISSASYIDFLQHISAIVRLEIDDDLIADYQEIRLNFIESRMQLFIGVDL